MKCAAACGEQVRARISSQHKILLAAAIFGYALVERVSYVA
jgi:hypothetical protein